MRFTSLAILALAAPAVASLFETSRDLQPAARDLQHAETEELKTEEPKEGQGLDRSSLVGISVVHEEGTPRLRSSNSRLSDLISSSDTPIISHDGSWGSPINYSYRRCDAPSDQSTSTSIQSGYMTWWTNGYPYRISFENGAGTTKSYILLPGAEYYFTKLDDGSLEVFRSGPESNNSQCRSYLPVETPIVKHVTYDSVTCNNAYHSMLQDAKNQVLNDLLLMSSDWVQTSATSVCTDTTTFGGTYNVVTETVSGSISVTENCESTWKQEFRRTPQEWIIRIGEPGTGRCVVDYYNCDTETNLFGERDSWGQMTVSCPYRLVYRG